MYSTLTFIAIATLIFILAFPRRIKQTPSRFDPNIPERIASCRNVDELMDCMNYMDKYPDSQAIRDEIKELILKQMKEITS
jgi:hypothetical protein